MVILIYCCLYALFAKMQPASADSVYLHVAKAHACPPSAFTCVSATGCYACKVPWSHDTSFHACKCTFQANIGTSDRTISHGRPHAHVHTWCHHMFMCTCMVPHLGPLIPAMGQQVRTQQTVSAALCRHICNLMQNEAAKVYRSLHAGTSGRASKKTMHAHAACTRCLQ